MSNFAEIPNLPNEIPQGATDNNLVLFIGAGVSQLLGCPSWNGLANGVLRMLAKNEVITYSEAADLARLDAKKRLSIAMQIANEYRSEKPAFRIDFEELLKHDSSKSSIYDYLNNIGCAYVTTNYDLLIKPRQSTASSRTPEPIKRLFKPSDIFPSRLKERGTVFHLHGCTVDDNSLILTTSQYLNHYIDENIINFLEVLFEEYTVLFVGYGLGELEILEHILRKGRAEDGRIKKRFLLQGFFENQRNVFERLREYYKRTFGVHLCGYIMDRKEYGQLEYVIKDWSSKIDVQDSADADDKEAIDRFFDGQS